MGIRLVFYFILQLPWLMPLTTSFQAGGSGCNETCGNVDITYPFGIETGCYNNSWFRVTCNETSHGPKPFISRINLELLNLWSDSDDIHNLVTVNNPVIHLNCDGKGNNSTTSPASVNLKDSPYVFTSQYNVFGSVGCGYLAIIFRNNQTDPLAVCLQQRCGDPVSSSSGGCYAQIPENLTSYTTALRSMTEITSPEEKEDSKRCTSTFMSDYSIQLSDISIGTTHVPATLKWNPVACDLEASLCPVVEPYAYVVPYKSSCNETCGNVDIPFPFGIEVGCYKTKWFRVTCNKTDDGEKPFISSINMQLLNVSFYDGTVTVNNSVTYSDCLGNEQENNGVSVDLTGTPFFFSNKFNRFMSVGCGNLATFLGNPNHGPRISGCKQPPCGDTITSTVGCSTNVPPALSSFAANITRFHPSNGNNRSCSSAFIVDVRDMRFLDLIDAKSDPNNTTTNRSWTHVPTTLGWATPKRGLCELGEVSGTVCSPDGRYCWTSLSQNHLCVCSSDNYEDYAYLSTDICQEAGKCADLKYKNCFMLCLNAPGNNCSSSCPARYEYSSLEDMCKPISFINSSVFEKKKLIERRNNIKLKQKYFKRNGGLLLQQQLSNNEGNVEKIKLFASKELEKATDYYNENRILGRGGQGTVFKGMLADGSIVAIKKSKTMEGDKLDDNELKQFINEVMILSQISHRNVVKLLGYCLETKVPLLVYEFVPNGTLSQLIDEPNEELPLTRKMRLRIAVEIANALSYLHSAASIPIYHRDIKSRQKPISSSQSEEVVRSLVNFFLLSMKENSLQDIVDPMVMNDGPEEEMAAVAKLAKRCLNLNGKKRPTMKEVAMELERIRSSEEANAIEQSTDEDSDIDNKIELSTTASCSMSGSSLNDSATLILYA
ncbi:hypothetical protein V6N13_033717 [Hibiscus sabdariffa]